MPLTLEELMKFDLFEACEKNMKPETWMPFYTTLAEIDNIDHFIKDAPSYPGSTDSIIRSEMISAIGATLSIEGTTLDKEEIEQSFGKIDRQEVLTRKEQEVMNSRDVYRFIMNFVKDNADNIVYSEQLIRQIHKEFTKDMKYVSNIPGEYRNNFVATFGVPRKESLCRTTDEIEGAMNGFVQWLNNINTEDYLGKSPFTRAMMAHYYLTEIHPFGDGNGRTARALEALILYAHGVNYYCFWSLANFWSANRDMYLTQLHNIRETLDPCEFVLWGLQGYRDEIERVKEKVLTKVKRLMIRDYAQYLLRSKRDQKIKINQRITHVLDILILRDPIELKKFMNLPEILGLYGPKSSSTRTRDIAKMLAANLIKLEKEKGTIEVNYGLLERLTYDV